MAKAKLKDSNVEEAETLETALGLTSKEVKVGDETVIVREFKLKQLSHVLRLVKDIVDSTGEQEVDGGLLMQAGDIGIKLAALATGKSHEWLEDLALGDGLALYAAIIEVNRSFFDQSDQIAQLAGLFAPLLRRATATNG